MPAALPLALRKRIIKAHRSPRKPSAAKLAERFDVGEATVKRLIARVRKHDTLEPKPRGGSKPKLNDEQQKAVATWVEEDVDITLAQIVDRVAKEFEITISVSAMSRLLGRLGFTRKKSPSS